VCRYAADLVEECVVGNPTKKTRARIYEISGIGAPLLLGIAMGVSGLINLKFAEILLWLSVLGFWLMICTGESIWKEKISTVKRSVISGVSAVCLLLVTLLAVHYLRIQIAAIKAKNIESEYPSVRMAVGQDKKIHVQNNGHHEIVAITIIPTEYALDAAALTQGAIHIDKVQKGMLPIANVASVSPGAAMPDVDLRAYAKISPFSGATYATDQTRFFALRIAFTGGIPAKEYVYYKITSSIAYNPFLPDNPEQIGMGGGWKENSLQIEAQIIDVLKQSQRLIYGTELEEYKP
jgi:hypothetical protein